ncbi:MAG: radical SAM protein [Candidatus Eremiobacteraeota bacterium]|nr:radical SAM protein [Candidatus Eremiobacteraeota bacterium]
MKVCLVLTHQCNLGCSYCYAGEKFKRTMSYESGLKSLALAFSKQGPVEVSFFGGEPMIAFSQMAALTRVARRWADRSGRQLRFAVTTNATILNEKHLNFLRDYNFFVGISVDGVEEEHDRHRPFVGGRGSGDLVWRNLERAADYLDDFRVLMVVRPDTVARLPEAIERMYRLGVSKVSLLPETEADWSDSRHLLADVYQQLARVCYFSMMTDEPMYISPFAELHPHLRSNGNGSGRGGCNFGRDEVAVSPAGNFYPCARLVGPDTRPEVRIGNLENGFDFERIEELNSCSEASLSKCGSGGCKCLALMPGDVDYQLLNVKMFTDVTGEACRIAAACLEEVAA